MQACKDGGDEDDYKYNMLGMRVGKQDWDGETCELQEQSARDWTEVQTGECDDGR